jgi:hypothetical protein
MRASGATLDAFWAGVWAATRAPAYSFQPVTFTGRSFVFLHVVRYVLVRVRQPEPDPWPGASRRADSRSAQSHRTTSRVSANRPARPGTLNIGIPILPLQHACLNAPTEANPNVSASADEPMSWPYRPASLASSSSTSSVDCRKSRLIRTHPKMMTRAILRHPAYGAREIVGKDAFRYRLTPKDANVISQRR